MAETNPYRIEEEKWTPNSVYEILPPNTVSWTNYQYSEGSDNVDSDKAHSSLLSGVVDFFGKLLGGVGKILGGAIEAGVGVLGGIVQGVTGLIGGIASAIGSIFGGGNNTAIEPPEPVFNPIKTNLEGAIQPHLDRIDEAKELIDGAMAEQGRIREDMAAQGLVGDEALSKAKQGIADAKAAQEGVANAVSQLTTVESALKNDIAASSLKAENALSEISKTNEALQANAAATADLVAGLQTDFAAEFEEISLRMGAIVETQGGLAEGLGKAATQADYNKLNEVLWGRQVDINQDQQELNKRRREWEEGAALALENLSEGAAAQTRWNAGAETAIDALARIMGLSLGGRNLLKKSNVNATNTSYRTAFAYFGDSVPEDGEEITISLKGSLGEGKKFFNFYNSGGSTYVDGVAASKRDSNGVYKVVTKWKTNGDDSYLDIYAVPESVNATSTVEWVKLERGNQATDWTPAPEDLPTQAQVDELQNNAISRLETVTGTTVNTVDALIAAVDSVKNIQKLNDDLWEQQQIIDEEQNKRAEMQEQLQRETLEVISRTIFYENNKPVFDDYVSVDKVDGAVTVTAKSKPSPWVGNLISIGMSSSSVKVEGTTVSDSYPVIRQFSIPHQTSRVINTGSRGSTRIDYWVQPGQMKVLQDSLSLPYITGSKYVNNTYTTFHTVKVPKPQGRVAVRLTANLLNADKGSTYGLRLRVTRPSTGTAARLWTRQTSNLGPLFPWESGKRKWTLYAEIDADGTEDLTVQLQGVSSGNSTQSRVSGIDYRITYIEGADEENVSSN